MKYRVALWALAGLLVVLFWDLYTSATLATTPLSKPPNWRIVQWTCPVLFAGSYFHSGLSIYWVLLANAATYGFVGLVIEMFRHPVKKAV